MMMDICNRVQLPDQPEAEVSVEKAIDTSAEKEAPVVLPGRTIIAAEDKKESSLLSSSPAKAEPERKATASVSRKATGTTFSLNDLALPSGLRKGRKKKKKSSSSS